MPEFNTRIKLSVFEDQTDTIGVYNYFFHFENILKITTKKHTLKKCTIRIHSSTHYGIIVRAIVISYHLRLLSIDFHPFDRPSHDLLTEIFRVMISK
jgi:hypothetical protein